MCMLRQLTFTFHSGPFGWWQRSPLFQFSGAGDPSVFTLISFTASYVLTRHYWRRCQKCFLAFWRHASFLISNYCRVLNIVCFLLGNSPASEFYMPNFGTLCLFHLHRDAGSTYLPMKMEQTECSEMWAQKVQTPGNYPVESIQHASFCLLASWPEVSSHNCQIK